MVMILKRVMANIVDISLFIALIVVMFLFGVPPLLELLPEGDNGMLVAGGTFVAIIAINSILQYPFLRTHQTIGKAFFGIKIVSTNPQRPLTVSIIIQRELFAKVLPMYLLCIPVLFGKIGQHDVATETNVVPK